jgi:hypothetical protein
MVPVEKPKTNEKFAESGKPALETVDNEAFQLIIYCF